MGGKGLRVRLGSGGMKVIIFKGGCFFWVGVMFFGGRDAEAPFLAFFFEIFYRCFWFLFARIAKPLFIEILKVAWAKSPTFN